MKKSGSGCGYRLVVDFPFNHTLYASLKSSITAGVSALNFGTSTLKGAPPKRVHRLEAAGPASFTAIDLLPLPTHPYAY